MTESRKRKRHASESDRKLALDLAVTEAYQRHFGSTTQREDAATDLGMDLGAFGRQLEHARLMGFDIEAKPMQAPTDGDQSHSD